MEVKLTETFERKIIAYYIYFIALSNMTSSIGFFFSRVSIQRIDSV